MGYPPKGPPGGSPPGCSQGPPGLNPSSSLGGIIFFSKPADIFRAFFVIIGSCLFLFGVPRGAHRGVPRGDPRGDSLGGTPIGSPEGWVDSEVILDRFLIDFGCMFCRFSDDSRAVIWVSPALPRASALFRSPRPHRIGQQRKSLDEFTALRGSRSGREGALGRERGLHFVDCSPDGHMRPSENLHPARGTKMTKNVVSGRN